MTDLQQQILDKLRAVMEEYPDLRLGQIVLSALYRGKTDDSWNMNTIYQIPDANLLRGLEKLEEE